MVEALTSEEREAFLAEGHRIGVLALKTLLDRQGVEKVGQLPRPDRVTLLAEMRKLPGFKRG